MSTHVATLVISVTLYSGHYTSMTKGRIICYMLWSSLMAVSVLNLSRAVNANRPPIDTPDDDEDG